MPDTSLTPTSATLHAARWMLRPPIALILLIALCCIAGASGLLLQHSFAAAALAADPAEPLADPEKLAADKLRPVAPEQAKAINRQQPVSASDNPAASPFRPAFAASGERMKSLDCLTSAIYYEAGMESEAGQRAVAQVVLNRVRHVAYPNSVCGVVYQGAERATGCQFTFTCDGSLARRPSASGWARARRVAEAALAGGVFAAVGRSTHYHADYVVPYWSPSLLKTATVGAHIFYRSPGRAGQAAAFTAQYAGIEPDVRFASESRLAETEGAETSLALRDPIPGIPEPPVADVPEERARELDRFALLDYKIKDRPAPARAGADLALEAALGSALGSGSKRPAALALRQTAP